MIHLGKRSRRPVIGALVAVTTAAVVLAVPGSAGAASKTYAPRPAAASASAVAASIPTGNQLRTTSSVTGETANGRTVTGTFTPGLTKVGDDGKLKVRGTLRAVIHRKAGGTFGLNKAHVWIPVNKINGSSTTPTAQSSSFGSAAAPAALAPGACKVLNLVLGPLDLDLLGLQVHLDKVVLNIIAQSGAGNLLGNLLCAVAGLLDGPTLSGLLSQVSALLNSILAILQA